MSVLDACCGDRYFDSAAISALRAEWNADIAQAIAGVSGAAWTKSFDVNIGIGVSSQSFTGIDANDILMMAFNVQRTANTAPVLWRVSVDNGVSFFAAGGNYFTSVNINGVQLSTANIADTSNTAAAVVTCNALILGCKLANSPKINVAEVGTEAPNFFVASELPINAVQFVVSGATFTAGRVVILTR